jgi:hypothetical protein
MTQVIPKTKKGPLEFIEYTLQKTSYDNVGRPTLSATAIIPGTIPTGWMVPEPMVSEGVWPAANYRSAREPNQICRHSAAAAATHFTQQQYRRNRLNGDGGWILHQRRAAYSIQLHIISEQLMLVAMGTVVPIATNDLLSVGNKFERS